MSVINTLSQAITLIQRASVLDFVSVEAPTRTPRSLLRMLPMLVIPSLKRWRALLLW